MYHEIDESSHGNNVVDGLNAAHKRYLKEQMELVGKLLDNGTSNIGILPSASKYISIKFCRSMYTYSQ